VAADYYRDSPDPTLVAGNPIRQFVVLGSINASWNLFEGHATDVAVAKAEVAEKTADVTLEKARRNLESQVETAVRSLEAAAAAEQLSELARSVSAEGLDVANERFRLGSANTLEVRDAQLKLTQAELALVGTQIDLQLANIDVRAAIGEL
jgi:outer membrane protein TolC